MRYQRKVAVTNDLDIKWDLVELEEAFYDVIDSPSFPPAEIFTDALDECEEDQVRHFVKRIAKSARKAHLEGRVLNVCWSSRHYPQITVPYCFTLRMEDGNLNDIKKFVHDGLATDLYQSDVLDLENRIVERARGVFLWASLVLQKLNRASDEGSCKSELVAILQSLPKEVDSLLKEIILSIQSRHRLDCLRLFQWLMYSPFAPFYLSEVELALSLSQSDFSHGDSLEA